MSAMAWATWGIGLAVIAVIAHHWFWERHYTRQRFPDERHFLKTEDGWTLALSRLRPGDGPAAGQPVLLCPGLACNHQLFDFDPERSLARHLTALGFDVWMLDPRGTGASERAGFSARKWRYGFAEHARYDAPAAIERVLAETGRERLLWVGHSMGGLMGYHAGALHPAGRRICGVVGLGSPADFSRHPEVLGVIEGATLKWVLKWWPVVRLGRLCTVLAPLAGWVRVWPESIFVARDNTRPEVLRRFMVEVVEDIPRRILDNFSDSIHHGRNLDGRPLDEARQDLAGIDPPVLAIAGDRDGVAPPESVHGATRMLTGCEVREVVVGREQGHGAHFGHLCLAVGEQAPRVVYPLISAWLLEHLPARG